MTPEKIRSILNEIKEGNLSVDEAMLSMRELPFEDLEFAKVDHHRELRTGAPEVIFCQGKTTEQIISITRAMLQKGNNILATRANDEALNALIKEFPGGIIHKLARIFVIKQKELKIPETKIAVVTAGTADIPVAEEAAITAEVFGNDVNRIFDVGVAGIHRLFRQLPKIREAKVIVAVAGMEGALPSVLGGLVDKPVIAVPTSVGYGANFNGLSALLTMLNSCSSGISVVNIDNGFGAGYLAYMINKL
ncbi:MAG TPA: nickel pincer cofactor biosynthesis protein LarB [Bacteroidales bacterium]|nr:nickel pincer cofactor biosynthesis protein LarB [Bacteroidales bacterium]